MKALVTGIALMVAVLVSAQSYEGMEELVRFTSEISADASLAVLSRILEAGEKPISEMVFEKGTYHFYPDKAWQVYRHISNHDDQLTFTPFPIVGMENISIDGQGSTFIFHGVMIPFMVDGSKNVSIKNVSLDWEMPFHSEGLVVANNLAENTYDLKFSKLYPYEIRDGDLVFINQYYEHNVGQMYVFDTEARAVAYNTQAFSVWGPVKQLVSTKHGNKVSYRYPFSEDPVNPKYSSIGKELKSRYEQISPGVVRVYNHPRTLPPVGSTMMMKGEKGYNRNSPAFHVTHTDGFSAQNINVYHAGGMGIIAENSADLILNHFSVVPPEGRVVSATSDATHFVGCRGKIEMSSCTFSNQLDDGTNIHGAYQEVADVLDEHTLGIRIGHFQQKGFRLGVQGDTIGIIRKELSMLPYTKLTVKSIQEFNGAYMLISFNEKLPVDVEAGDVLENETAYPDVLIQNCDFSKNRARGIIIATSGEVVIKDNFFHNDMEAIILSGKHISHWYESGHAENVLIENNTFVDCSYGGGRGGVISSHGYEGIKKNIRIINNTFDQFDNLILDINNTDGLVFEGNTIRGNDHYPVLHPENPAFRLFESKNIVFIDNNYKGKARVLIEKDSIGLSSYAGQKPNIVLFFVDDLGWADLGYQDEKFHSPNIDKLKDEGLYLSRAYIPTPTCSPSRASLLTGKESVRIQMVRHISGPQTGEYNMWETDPEQMPSRNFLPLEEITYAERLKDFGYYNMFLGKWHLGQDEKYWPRNQGFDEEYCTGNQYHHSFKPYYETKDGQGKYKTDLITEQAVSLIEGYNRDQPFMMSVWYYNVHRGFQGRKDWVEFHRERGLEGDMLEYAAMVSVVDESVGKIREALTARGIAENTIILFTSDQGGTLKNAHLRGGKKGGETLCEGGARVPFIIHYPGETQAKSVCNTPIQTVDVYPTLIEIASGKKCKDKQIQGLSLLPVLRGKTLKERKLFFYRSYEDQYAAIRDGDWKLIKYRSGKYELYNLENDEEEQNNQVELEVQIAGRMKNELAKWEMEAVPEY